MKFRQTARYPVAWAIVLLCCTAFSLQSGERAVRSASGPAANLSVILGRPTEKSATLSVLSATEIEVRIEHGVKPGDYSEKVDPRTAKAGAPLEFDIGALKPDTYYYYRLLTRAPGKGEFRPEPEGTFHTQRAPGSAFTFALQGDSHPEREGKMYDPGLYALTMRNVAQDAPDFYLTLGDDFSIERLIERDALSQSAVDQVYAYQRSFLGLVGRSAPLFLVNGNHEQAARCNLNDNDNNAAVLAGRARTRFFPLPAPDTFYGGDAEEVERIGLLRDYYSWTWGDALFVVIDPYWHSTVVVDNEAGKQGRNKDEAGDTKGEKGQKRNADKKRDLWGVTLGDAQYQWLTKTLTGSKARWKFVFSHHVLGTGRGGIECASLYEWGGKNKRGDDEFRDKRPGWKLPIHQLMAKTGVTIFFQGHDHVFCRQELDGVVYQSTPNPADNTYQAFNRDAYRTGDVLPNSGHLRVNVAPDSVRVDYVRAFLPADEKGDNKNGSISHSYTIPANREGGPK